MDDNRETIAEVLVSAAQSIWSGADIQITVNLPVADRLKTAVSEGTNLNLQQVYITDSDIRHIKKRHGSGERALGQVDVIPDDFAALPTILEEYDEITRGEDDKQGNARFMLTKRMEETAYLATIQRGRRKLEVRTFYKRKPGAS
jgi:hypothetical protein